MSKYNDYEYEKQVIAQSSKTVEEYEMRLKELINRLRI